LSQFHALGTFIALDFETTGLSPEFDTIIEIGAIRFDAGVETARYSTLVNPKRQVSPEISQLTGISNQDLLSAPSLDAVRKDFARFLTSDDDGRQFPIMAHNAGFEKAFLHHIFGTTSGSTSSSTSSSESSSASRFGGNNSDDNYVSDDSDDNAYVAPPMLDTKDLLALMYPLAPSLSLEAFIRDFGIRDFEHHRGLQDALDMIDVVKKLDAELSKPEFASLCAIVEYWFGTDKNTGKSTGKKAGKLETENTSWLWRSFFAGRHKDEPLPDYRNFKEIYGAIERSDLPTKLAEAPLRLGDPSFFAPAFSNYQLRSAQQTMAERASRTLNDGGIYVAEAGTGTGKTLAYLTAALSALAADASSPVVVSTHTKALQNQFLDQELPRIQALFGVPELRAVALKGMSNYACLRKVSEALPEDERLFGTSTDALFAGAFLTRWLDQTLEGEVDELPRPLHDYAIIKNVSNDSRADFRDCTRHQCSFYEECFFFKKQWQAQSAHILAVNHSLLLTYPKSYPAFDRLVVDEADELPVEAVEAFSGVASQSRIRETLHELSDQFGVLSAVYGEVQVFSKDTKKAKQSSSASPTTLPNLSHIWGLGTRSKEILATLNTLMAEVRRDDVFTIQATLSDAKFSQDQRVRLLDGLENLRVLLREVVIVAEKTFKAAVALSPSEATPAMKDLQYRWEDGEKIEKILADFLEQNERKAALYVRIEKFEWSVVVSPYNIGELFAENVGRKLHAAVFASATISSTRDMKDFNKALGLNLFGTEDSPKALSSSRFESPFDYRNNSQIVFLKNFPSNAQPQFAQRSAEFIAEAARKLGGRTLVLFTSKARLQQVHKALFGLLNASNIDLFSHGITSPSQIKCVEQFKRSRAAVLMGARGLWKGVDIPGDDLQCLVLEKMPYAVPNPYTKGLQDALVLQYSDDARKRGEQPDSKRLGAMAWNEVDKPLMFQAFRQMFGRLIRTETDRGIMYVLDSQLQSGTLSNRHKQLLELLPSVPYKLADANPALDEIELMRLAKPQQR
jgi:ATP-dependent DNA helicase DinG